MCVCVCVCVSAVLYTCRRSEELLARWGALRMPSQHFLISLMVVLDFSLFGLYVMFSTLGSSGSECITKVCSC